MNTTKKGNGNQKNDRALKEKTYQDYNKQQPDPNDPNQVKNHQIGEEEEGEIKKREITANAAYNLEYRTSDQKTDFIWSLNKRQNQNFNKGRL